MDTPGTQLKDGYRCVLSRRDVLGEAAIPFLFFFFSRNRDIPCLSSLFFFRKPLLAAVVWCWALPGHPWLHSAVTGSYIPGTHSIAFVTCLNEHIARDIARYGLLPPLLACLTAPKCSIFPCHSVYFWKGELEESTEILLVRLTLPLRACFHFRSIHPFEIPDIISLPIDQGNPLYLRWIGENLVFGNSGTLLSGAGGTFYILGFAVE
uniref:Uncharacterized protein n=1 Tax=Zosterops lateralis melanops TaxID=1220523 RepID=A0A8D2PMJ1_ZOSLA